ncbi:unnamed protein product [Mesocestoides corti]|uniref:protein-tyrosine-phosphatase n=1 Tax=Mesocestoides corti TaxID=53468 RepID=A0A158QVL8_MESCO|nr:unnamed protein product [Mesocestoides corti]
MYFIRLTPRDPVGVGPKPLTTSVCTGPGIPTVIPNVTLTSITNTSATFNLSLDGITPSNSTSDCPGSYKPYEYLAGPFHGFLLTVETTSPRSTVKLLRINNRTKSYTVPHLTPFTQYRVNVSVSNGRTFGLPAVLNFTTKEGFPDPPRIHVESRSTNSLRLSFVSSNSRGVVLGYRIKWAECSNSSTTKSDESKEAYFIITGLRNSTCYQMQASSQTSVGYGNYSSLTQDFTLCPDFPAPNISNISATTDGIRLSWTYDSPPASPNGNHLFLACMESSVSSVCEDVAFNYTFRPSGNGGYFSYTFPFHGVNLVGGTGIILNFTVRSVCLPRDCKRDWPCQSLSNYSNVLQLDIDQLSEILARSGFSELSDKAIGGIISAVFAIILMICVCSLSILYCRSSRAYKRRHGGLGVAGDDLSGCGGGETGRTPLVTPKMRRFEESPHKPIPAELLVQHVASYHADDDAGYQAEFENPSPNCRVNPVYAAFTTLPADTLLSFFLKAIEQCVRTNWPTSVARLPENMPKNRYSNVFAYDHTRVILRNPHGRRSDYINANYVDGFCGPRAFIAAQGPKDITFDDFWQMVWDENSNIIVMISNFVERGRRKCDQYWPSDGQQTYGSISVRMLSENKLACYVARVFLVKNVKCKKASHLRRFFFAKERIVRHYQYTDWRDFDVPLSALPVLVFVKTTVKDWTPTRGPIIVHCSAGVGRTGTYICIESLIRQLDAEKQVNIRGFLEHIRQQRMKLVQTEQQYAFIHDALREYLLCPEHEISALSFPAYAQCLRVCTDHIPRAYEFTEARKPVNEVKNRLSHLIPTDSRRVTLPNEPGVDGSTYINASIVQGYYNLQEFIVTQHPLTFTEADFWKMVWDKNSPMVFVLSSEDMPVFWPTGAQEVSRRLFTTTIPNTTTTTITTATNPTIINTTTATTTTITTATTTTSTTTATNTTTITPRVIGWLRVGFCDREEVTDGLTRYEFLLSSSREDYALTCHLWRLHNWPTAAAETRRDFLKLQSILVSDHASSANGSTIVVDDYGGNRAGIFCAVNVLINQLTMAGYIDVYFIVKMLHLQRTGIFKSCEDLDFIYSVMEQFLCEMQQQDDSSSCLGNDSSGYANLSLFNGKIPSMAITSNAVSKSPSANGDIAPSKNPFFPLLLAEEDEEEEEETAAVLVEEKVGLSNTLELHSLSSAHKSGASTSPSVIGVLTPVKKANGYVNEGQPLPPFPSQSPPPWPPKDDLERVCTDDDDDDPTPTTSLVGGVSGGSLLDDAELAMTV